MVDYIMPSILHRLLANGSHTPHTLFSSSIIQLASVAYALSHVVDVV